MRASHVNQGKARQRVRQWLPPSPKYHVPVFVACILRFSFSSPSPPSLPPPAAVNITLVDFNIVNHETLIEDICKKGTSFQGRRRKI
ncbi:hypothetical protein GBA52_018220 [Prunus armeniaca]|nr:hypothetical protein GBA52_018220 [Prunus armeniaca]